MNHRMLAVVAVLSLWPPAAPAVAHAAPADQATTYGLGRLATPVRVLDTTINPFAYGLPQPCARVAGLGGIPSAATGVFLKVTLSATESSHIDERVGVYSSDDPLHDAAWTLSLGHTQSTAANGTIVRLGRDGGVCVQADGGTVHVTLDAVGYVLPDSPVVLYPHVWQLMQYGGADTCYPVAGARELDTTGRLVPNGNVIPSDAAGVVLIVMAVPDSAAGGRQPGFISAYPDGQDDPGVPVTTFAPGGPSNPNTAFVDIGADGQVCFATHGNSNTLIDLEVLGYVRAG